MNIKEKYYYTSCATLPLYNFFQAAEGHYSYLFKTEYRSKFNRCKQDDISSIWEAIMSEYTDLMGEGTNAAMMINLKNMSITYNELVIVGGVIKALDAAHNEELADVLRSMGYRYEHDPLDPEKARKCLEVATIKLKKLAKRVEELQLEHKKEINQSVKQKHNYEVTLSNLSRFQGYRLDKYTITVSEYAAIIKQYQEHAKQLKKQHGK